MIRPDIPAERVYDDLTLSVFEISGNGKKAKESQRKARAVLFNLWLHAMPENRRENWGRAAPVALDPVTHVNEWK